MFQRFEFIKFVWEKTVGEHAWAQAGRLCVLSGVPLPFLFRCLSFKYEETDNTKQSRTVCRQAEKTKEAWGGSVNKPAAAKRYNMADGEVDARNEDS